MIKIFDFDGTLIDLWPRYHAVFCDLAGVDLPLKDYKEIKRRFKKDEAVADYFKISLPYSYFEKKSILLEDREYLSLDRLFFSEKKIVKLLAGKTIILSKRKNRENLEWELSRLGIECKFEIVPFVSKTDWIIRNLNEPIIAAGDSIEDLKIGKLSNTEIHMVGYGLGTELEFKQTGIKYYMHENPIELYNKFVGAHV